MRAFVNVCRHRAATLLAATGGDGLRSIRCPYHAWTYGLDGCLQAFPGAEPGFDDVDKASHGLVELPAAEAYGLIFVLADPTATRSPSTTRCTAPRTSWPTSTSARTSTSRRGSGSGTSTGSW